MKLTSYYGGGNENKNKRNALNKEQYNPSLMLAYRIAEVFDTTIEELCCLKENKELEDQKNA